MKWVVDGVWKAFGSIEVFRGLSVEFEPSSITVVLGPSGCGKTTLLNLLAGLVEADQGVVRGGGRVSYLFQEPRLLPWKTLRRNLEFVAPDREREITEMLELVGLSRFERHFPRELSGGMRQRAAMARAFVVPSDILLMDEPFQALDLALRLSLVATFMRLWEARPRTTVFVTHDIQEAILLADRVLVLGAAPAEIRSECRVYQPRAHRSLESAEMLDVERLLYRVMMGQATT